MADETKHGFSNAPGENPGGHGPIECSEFEALLTAAIDEEALYGDGQLTGARKEAFDAHRQVCGICGPMFAEVQAGREWLRSLEPVEPPVYMVHNVLAATSGVFSTRSEAALLGRTQGPTTGGRAPFSERAREWWDSFMTPTVGFVRQPRFVMSFGMIFFSFSLALSAAGVKPKDVAKVDLRPSALRHAYIDAQIKVVKYYDNIRFVYEIESKLRELKRANTPAEPGPVEPKTEQKENRKNDTSGQPEERQDRNYSQEYNQPVLAALRTGAPIATVLRDGVERAVPAVTGTTNRRFV
jgi:hypothetical protein